MRMPHNKSNGSHAGKCQPHKVVALLLVATGLLTSAGWASPTFYGPSPYLSFSQSPFSGTSFLYFYLETFEDGALNTPGVTPSSGWLVAAPGIATDSVDADDGIIDGFGRSGHSFFSTMTQTNLTVTFSAAALGGHLPTHVGIVCTDANAPPGSSGYADVTFSAKDNNGVSLGSVTAVHFGDGLLTGQTAEDRFFGVYNPEGISSFSISEYNCRDWEVDHLQYGLVPEPSVTALVGIGALSLLGWHRRRNGR